MAYDCVIGMDVGKYFHHACVLDPQSRQVLSQRINQHEGSLRKIFGKFLANDAEVLVVVDQPNNIGRLTVAVAQAIGADVRYLPGLDRLLAGMWPAVNGAFFLPTYGTIVAAINFDRTGTTRIGKFVFNHSFMLPGVVAIVAAVATGMALGSIFG
ncbi:transposase [Corynebacterium diphtheriae]|nr:transposase [Corynebacterium diphtheriae]